MKTFPIVLNFIVGFLIFSSSQTFADDQQSICGRSLEVRSAIMKEVGYIRYANKGVQDPVKCNQITVEELGQVKSLILANRGIVKLARGDLAGLSLDYLDLSQNEINWNEVDNYSELPLNANIIFGLGENEMQGIDVSHVALIERMRQIEQFVDNGWHLPLKIEIDQPITTSSDHLSILQRVLAIRQIEEIKDAYYSAAYDFFEVAIRFTDKKLTGDKVKILGGGSRIEITLSVTGGEDQPEIAHQSEILAGLGEEVNPLASNRWYIDQKPSLSQIEHAIDRDTLKLTRLWDRIEDANYQMSLLIDKAASRAKDTSKELFYSSDELHDARVYQYTISYGLQLALNTAHRWQTAATDSNFAWKLEAKSLAATSARIYQTGRDRFLYELVKNKSSINIFNSSFWHRPLLLKVLDQGVSAGTVRSGNRQSIEIPDGSIASLLANRTDGDYADWLESLEALSPFNDTHLMVDSYAASKPLTVARLNGLDGSILKSREKGTIGWGRSVREYLAHKVKGGFESPVKSVIAGVAGWLGDTRYHSAEHAITREQVQTMKPVLKPGDIMLEREEFFLSNKILPGFWKHAILYLGDKADWSKFKDSSGAELGADSWIQSTILPNYVGFFDKQEPALVMEALSEGVLFNTLEHAAGKDFIAILRPVLPAGESEAMIADSIKKVLPLLGTPYDFDFDFTTDSKVVCTELIYRAYNGVIPFDLKRESKMDRVENPPGLSRVAGTLTFPANDLAKLVLFMNKYPEPRPELGYPGKRLELVKLYMRVEGENQARVYEGDEALKELAKSVNR